MTLQVVYGQAIPVIVLDTTDLTNTSNTHSAYTGYNGTDLDNSQINYPEALATLSIPSGFLFAPDAGSTIDLYVVKKDASGTAITTPAPAASDIVNRAHYLGSFPVDNQTASTAYKREIKINIKGLLKGEFHIVNNSGQTIDVTPTAATLTVTPFSVKDV